MRLSGRSLCWLLPGFLILSTAAQVLAQDANQTPTWDIARILKDAEQGNSWAQFNLGNAYATGKGVPKDEAEAVHWYRKAAEQGNSFAEQAIEQMSASSQGASGHEATQGASQPQTGYTDRPIKQAESGDAAKAEYALGRAFATGDGVSNNAVGAAEWYLKSAQHGLAQAQNAYGEIQNEAADAVYWYRKAAQQGDATAQYNLANAYAEGRGVTKDRAEAARWYQKAAEQGLAKAQYALGNAYATGGGVTKDAGEGARWYGKAAVQGYTKTQSHTDVVEQARIARAHVAAKEEAVEVQRTRDIAALKANAESGQWWAQYDLGLAYHEGQGVSKDDAAALRWLCAAGDQGYNPAKMKYEELGPVYRVAATKKLGIHEGQPQAVVKSILQRNGFTMPWNCTGSWQGATWYSTCVTYRGRSRQDFYDKISMNFSVHHRVRYTNPDTQVSTIVDEPVDRLTDVNFFWGKND